MTRPDIAMTTAEVDAFVVACPAWVVGAIGPDGWPVGTIARPVASGGALSVVVDPADPVLAALAADDRVCCLADEHAAYTEIRGVILRGRAHPQPGGRLDIAVEATTSFDFARIG
jgi:hypothetical protein